MALTMNCSSTSSPSARPGTLPPGLLTLRLVLLDAATEADPGCVRVAAIGRIELEDYKQWLAGAQALRSAVDDHDPVRNLRLVAIVLRTDHRLGLRRRTAVPVFPGDFPQAGRAALEVPRRPDRCEVHGCARTIPTDAAGHGRDPRPHGHAPARGIAVTIR